MEKISSFKWFNNVGDVVCFNPSTYESEPIKFEKNFSYNHKKNELNSIGVSWLYGDKLIEIPNIWYLSTLPLPEMDKVFVTLYNNGNFEYYIYNADGSIFKKLLCPERRPPYDGDCTFIYEIGWIKTTEGDFTMVATLQGKCDPYYEDRLFNPKSGNFGEVIGSGRR